MAKIGKRELASLGLISNAGEPPRKSTRRGPQGQASAPGNRPHAATPPVQQLDEQPPAKAEATSREQSVEQPLATVAGAAPLEQPENGSAQVASDKGSTEPSLRVCAVCADGLGEGEFPSLGACTHQADICRHCLSRWVAGQLNTQAWDRLTCPSSECKIRLTQVDLQPHVTAEVSERWDRLALQAALRKVPGYFSCPSAGCNHSHVHDDEGANNNIWLCQIPTCGARICTVHDVPFHTGETCAQYDERKANEDHGRAEIATKAELARYAKTCPNLECGVHIHKDGGCDHITCRVCRHEFCWRCSAPFDGVEGIRRVGNSAHARDCEHYRPPGNEEQGQKQRRS